MPTKTVITNLDNNSILKTLFALSLSALVVLVILNIYWYYQLKQAEAEVYVQKGNLHSEKIRLVKEGIIDDVPVAEEAVIVQDTPLKTPLQQTEFTQEYTSPNRVFKFMYPQGWKVAVINPERPEVDPQSGKVLYYGSLRVHEDTVEQKSSIQITYGDGFGGGECAGFGGNLETFSTGSTQKISLCHVDASKTGVHSWFGSCGDCGLITPETSFAITADLQPDYQQSRELLEKFLSGFVVER